MGLFAKTYHLWPLMLFLLACSSTTGPEFISLPPDVELKNNGLQTAGRLSKPLMGNMVKNHTPLHWISESIPGTTSTYRRVDPTRLPYQLFFTAIRDCAVEDSPGAATTRQLLVGFEDVEIRAQEKTAIADRNLTRTLASARLDGQALQIFTYTYRAVGCMKDYVFWMIFDDPEEEPDSFIEHEEERIQIYLNEVLQSNTAKEKEHEVKSSTDD